MGRREDREERLERANDFIHAVASHGRRFFCHEGVVCWLEIDARERIWFVDSWRGERIYTHHHGAWRRFHHGGTLKGLVECLRDFVRTGARLSRRLFYWPDWYCSGDLWGYGEAMAPVREAAERLGLIVEPENGRE